MGSSLFDKVVYQNKDGVSHAKMVAVPCLLFELPPMNKFVVDINFTR